MKLKLCYILVVFVTMLSSSCEYGRQAEEQLNNINSQVKDLDSLVNEGIEKVSDFETILPETGKRLKEADSIIRDTSTTLDSLKQKVNDIENIFN